MNCAICAAPSVVAAVVVLPWRLQTFDVHHPCAVQGLLVVLGVGAEAGVVVKMAVAALHASFVGRAWWGYVARRQVLRLLGVVVPGWRVRVGLCGTSSERHTVDGSVVLSDGVHTAVCLFSICTAHAAAAAPQNQRWGGCSIPAWCVLQQAAAVGFRSWGKQS